MPSDLGSELDKAYQELRGIESEIAVLSGRTQQDRTRRRIVVDSTDSGFDNLHANNDRRVFETGNSRRIVITAPNTNVGNGFSRKRTYYGMDENNDVEDRSNLKPAYQPPQKRTLQSSVVMPTIETKSRAEIITEIKKSEKKEDTVRNRRLFSNLIVGTLKQFQKEERTVKEKVQAQTEKQREIERRLELTEQENRDRINKEKEKLLERRRQKEQEILRLKRERAIIKYAEEKEQHFRRLQCFIQTQTKPPIFFLPAKHTLRTLELLKESAKKVEGLILLRRDEMERELHRDRVTTVKVVDEEFDEDENLSVGLRSAVVAVVKNEKTEDKDASKADINEDKSSERSNDLKLKNKSKDNGVIKTEAVEKVAATSSKNKSDKSRSVSPNAATVNSKQSKSNSNSESSSSDSDSQSSSESEENTKTENDGGSSSDDEEAAVDEKRSVSSGKSGARSSNSEVNNEIKAEEELDH